MLTVAKSTLSTTPSTVSMVWMDLIDMGDSQVKASIRRCVTTMLLSDSIS